MKNYRFSIDDNIWFLKDLAKNNYSSIFQNDYLDFLKLIHQKFGTKIQLNIYYATDCFTLAEMPDKYKKEWESVSDWLRLSFHAYSDDTRYSESDYETIKKDVELIHSEIKRFAGEKSISYYTTLHYVACPKVGVEAMRDCGIKGLVGIYGTDEKPRIPYHLTPEISAYMRNNSFYKDEEIGMLFMKNNIVLNEFKYEDIVPAMEKDKDSEFFEIMIHEQYYYPSFKWFQGCFKERVELAIKWVTDHGYISTFFEEIFD